MKVDYYTKMAMETKEEMDFDPVIPSEVLNKAVSLLFGDTLSNSNRSELEKYIRSEYETLHCVVMLITDKERTRSVSQQTRFTRLCSKLEIDPGRKEVIITDKKKLLYSRDYFVSPSLVN